MVYHKLFFDRFQYLYQIPANFTYQICPNLLSLPVRERGLKFIDGLKQLFIPSSLPVRERGLKSEYLPEQALTDESLPVRERGLKLICFLGVVRMKLSLPVRERGLKLLQFYVGGEKHGRSPCGSVD